MFKFYEVIILKLVQVTNENEETMEEVVTRNKWQKITSLMGTNWMQMVNGYSSFNDVKKK